MDISGLDKVQVLKALWLNMKPAAFFSMSGLPSPSFNEASAAAHIAEGYIDYYDGRCIKMSLKEDVIDTRLYDRDARTSAAEVIAKLRVGKE